MKPAVAILQARMGSTRLPGKVLKPVLGRPLLYYQLERLRHCASIDEVILATTSDPSDDPVAAFGEAQGLQVFRGSINDVLDRYHGAAAISRSPQVPLIIRVTGDCPLLAPEICDAVVAKLLEEQADYCGSSERFAEGLDCEVFTRAALETSWREAKLVSEREHVTLFMRNHPEHFKLCELTQDADDGDIRITVDEAADLEVVSQILTALYKPGEPPFPFSSIREFLRLHPELFASNADIPRNAGLMKSLAEDHEISE